MDKRYNACMMETLQEVLSVRTGPQLRALRETYPAKFASQEALAAELGMSVDAVKYRERCAVAREDWWTEHKAALDRLEARAHAERDELMED